MIKYLLIPLLSICLFFSCKKDSSEMFSGLKMQITEKSLTVLLNTEKSFSVVIPNGKTLTSVWNLDGAVVGTATTYIFKPTIVGDYNLTYIGSNAFGNFTHTYQIHVTASTDGVNPNSSRYISKIFEYLPAPGQHINQANLGSLAQAQMIVGNVNNTLSLGGFGGYIVFGFNQAVINKIGYDLGVYGNPQGGATPFAEPGIVMVSQDKNGNGLPDDEWFELAGSEYNKPTTVKNYEITYTNPNGFADVQWVDNQGNNGVIKNLNKNKNHYPLFAANQSTLTFKGTLLPFTLNAVGLTINQAFNWGYADSFSIGDDYASSNYNSFDISWAVDGEGKKVDLKTIDFIKIYTAQNGNAGLLGEISTDITGAIDLNIK